MHGLVRIRSLRVLRGEFNSELARPCAFLALRSTAVRFFKGRGQRRTWTLSRLLGDNFAVFPNVNWSSVHARRFARDFGGAAECATDGRRKLFCFFFYLRRLHGPSSNSRGFAPELSYTLQVSAKRR